MRALTVIGAVVLALVLGAASVPFMFWALGCAVLGDDAASDRALDAAPLSRFIAWSHRAS